MLGGIIKRTWDPTVWPESPFWKPSMVFAKEKEAVVFPSLHVDWNCFLVESTQPEYLTTTDPEEETTGPLPLMMVWDTNCPFDL